MNDKVFSNTRVPPPRCNSPCRGEGVSHQEVLTQVRQQEELVRASLFRLIRTNRSSSQYLFVTCQYGIGRLISYINLYHLFVEHILSYRFCPVLGDMKFRRWK